MSRNVGSSSRPKSGLLHPEGWDLDGGTNRVSGPSKAKELQKAINEIVVKARPAIRDILEQFGSCIGRVPAAGQQLVWLKLEESEAQSLPSEIRMRLQAAGDGPHGQR